MQRLCLGLVVALFTLSAPEGAEAQDARVALPKISGSSRARPKTLRKAIRARLRREEIKVVSSKRLAKAARRVHRPQTSVKSAKAARANYLITARVSRSGGKYLVKARLRSVPSGRTLKTVKVRYKRKSSASKKGATIGRVFANAIWADVERKEARQRRAAAAPVEEAYEPEEEVEEEAAPPPPPRRSRRERAEREAPRRSRAAARRPPREEEPEPREESKRSSRGWAKRSPEQGAVRLQLGVGSQLYTGYSVLVGSRKTALAHTISPLFAGEVGLSFQVPKTGFGGDLRGSYVPVSFKLNVTPPVTPAEPAGGYISASGDLFYQFKIGKIGRNGAWMLAPVAVVDYTMLKIDEQVMILGWTNLSAGGGLRLTARARANFAFYLEGLGRYILSYSETPAKTGESPKGFGLTISGGLRFWFSKSVGMYGRATYRYDKITTTGAGTRRIFDGDPELQNASVYYGAAQAVLGISFLL